MSDWLPDLVVTCPICDARGVTVNDSNDGVEECVICQGKGVWLTTAGKQVLRLVKDYLSDQ